MKKLLVLVVAMMFSVGAFAEISVKAEAKDATDKTEKAAPLNPEEIQKQISEKTAALETEKDAKKKAALKKEIKELQAQLPKKKVEDKKVKKAASEE